MKESLPLATETMLGPLFDLPLRVMCHYYSATFSLLCQMEFHKEAVLPSEIDPLRLLGFQTQHTFSIKCLLFGDFRIALLRVFKGLHSNKSPHKLIC